MLQKNTLVPAFFTPVVSEGVVFNSSAAPWKMKLKRIFLKRSKSGANSWFCHCYAFVRQAWSLPPL
jgi:hypothetical protein